MVDFNVYNVYLLIVFYHVRVLLTMDNVRVILVDIRLSPMVGI